jgi:predicted GIY-YIG superfamily endonuclease
LYNAEGENLKPSEIPYEGSGAYMFAASRGRSEKHTLYVGSTKNLKQRLYSHSYGDNIWKSLEKLQDKGYRLWYRVHATSAVWEAQRLEENALTEWWCYPLNTLGNPTR